MITTKPKKTKIEIDLSGPQGNAFSLLAISKDLSNKLGLNWDEIHQEMTSGDYDNLVQTMDKHFGDYIIIYK
jgi:hypothetical protein